MTSETGGYEAALGQFARGKRLARLAKYVRARSDDRCDACGSTLPRLLFGLKDAQTERCYFVGQNCLNWLLESGLIARARFRQTSETAYEREMKLRRDGQSAPVVRADEILVPASAGALPPTAEESASSAVGLVKGRWVRQDGALVFEQPESRLNRVLILIAISGPSYPCNGADGYG
ncbi:MAG: hypothetical protein E6I09_05185 [Chloroflexi bacterium]|nr:MAG: hypothetical protein E6I09_05185 [Chloroflexota bacterium]